jgi:hypothetical protein
MNATKQKTRNLGLAKRRALRIIRRSQPKNVQEARAAGLRLWEIGVNCGAFRQTYRIWGTGLVIKFPREEWGDAITHTRDEVKKIRALNEFKVMRRYLPPVYYYNGRDGVMVTDYYSKVSPPKNLRPMFTELLFAYTGVEVGDLLGDNIRCKRNGEPVIVDLGY